jgi:Zn-finger nucleic acid-binding protein
MKCPIDGETLQITDRQGVEIDFCPKCRGVWLDRGELDKIIEKTTPQSNSTTRHSGGGHKGDYKKSNKKQSILSEIFDFDFF